MDTTVPWIMSCYSCGRNIESKRPLVRRALNNLRVRNVRQDYLSGLLPENLAKALLEENRENLGGIDPLLILRGLALPSTRAELSDRDIEDWQENLIENWYSYSDARQYLKDFLSDISGIDPTDVATGRIKLIRPLISEKLSLKEIRNFARLGLIDKEAFAQISPEQQSASLASQSALNSLTNEERSSYDNATRLLDGHLLTKAEESLIMGELSMVNLQSLLRDGVISFTDTVEIIQIVRRTDSSSEVATLLRQKDLVRQESNLLNGSATLEEVYELTSSGRLDGNFLDFIDSRYDADIHILTEYSNIDDAITEILNKIWKAVLFDDRRQIEDLLETGYLSEKMKFLIDFRQKTFDSLLLSKETFNNITGLIDRYAELTQRGKRPILGDLTPASQTRILDDLRKNRQERINETFQIDFTILTSLRDIRRSLILCGVWSEELNILYALNDLKELLKGDVKLVQDQLVRIPGDALRRLSFPEKILEIPLKPTRYAVELALNAADITADCCRTQAINPPVMLPGLKQRIISKRLIKNDNVAHIKNPLDTIVRYERDLKSTIVLEARTGTVRTTTAIDAALEAMVGGSFLGSS